MIAAADGGAPAAPSRALGAELVELPSGAGHDAQILAAWRACPAAMLFVRSDAGGVSATRPRSTPRPTRVAACVAALEPALRELVAA